MLSAHWYRDDNEVSGQSSTSMGMFWEGRVLGSVLNRNGDFLAGKHMCSALQSPRHPERAVGLAQGHGCWHSTRNWGTHPCWGQWRAAAGA